MPNQRTFAPLWKTCAILPCFVFGIGLHSLSFKLGLSTESYSGSALVSFYFKSRLPIDAHKVFDEISDKDEVCYAAMVCGLAQNSRPIDALSVFAEMKCCDVETTVNSVSGALRAAAGLAALEQCRILHAHVVVAGLVMNVVVATSLIDAYGKAGIVSDARIVFDENLERMNLVGWNAMIASYAQLGNTNLSVDLFNSMITRGFQPDEYSFLAILSSFHNAGMAVEIEQWFNRMRLEYGMDPMLEHYTCLIGALGRAGRLQDAERIAMSMPFKPDAAVWRVLLSNCAHHDAADMAWSMAKRLLELDSYDDSAYVIAANVLAGCGRWDEVAEVRKMMKDRRVKKTVGRSWIEVRGNVHVFLAGDRTHEMKDLIYAKLADMKKEIEKLGYVPVWNQMLHEVGEQEKREALWYHSEKLALAFAVVSGAAPPGKELRIVKNLRICGDCHEVFKYMSIVLEREIIVRDANRYHRFCHGRCSCADTW